MIASTWIGGAPQAVKALPPKPIYKPLADNEPEELIRLRIFRDNAIEAAIKAEEKIAQQEMRIAELVWHLATMRDVLFKAFANTAHLLPVIQKESQS